jgi:hypothetical protein
VNFRNADPVRPDFSEAPGPWEALVAAILSEAGPELARRRREQTLSGLISGWSRPIFSAAMLVIVASATALLLSTRRRDGAVGDDGSVTTPLLAEALVGEELAGWLEGGDPLSLAEFVEVLEEREDR